ncbi:hypothetical protein F5Y17DRAFT_461988 [Xylariaceae sp. FL0594]|nr:hypothetical protein F5Y17DRAFT_461988 [Xylariaceae sp. FL0594]
MFSPELNPKLSPEEAKELEKNTFANSTNDYVEFDEMIDDWNSEDRFQPENSETHPGPALPALSIEAFSGREGCLGSSEEPRYDLRGGKPAWKSLYTFVDPRKYHRWTTTKEAATPRASRQTSRKKQTRRVNKSVAGQPVGTRARKVAGKSSLAISLWTEFNLETLNASYGHILDSPVPAGELVVPQPDNHYFSTRTLVAVNNTSMLTQWCDAVLSPTLEYARKTPDLHTGTALIHDIDNPAHQNPFTTVVSKANHTVALDEPETATLINGLGRLSSQISKDNISKRKDAGPTREDNWEAAIQVVPWTKSGERQLTTDLALWWLCMLAISDPDNRRLTGKAGTVRIDQWVKTYHDDRRGWVRKHRYSGFEEPCDPPTPPAYRLPSPNNIVGQLAVWEAEVGVNADPNFELYPGNEGQPHHWDNNMAADFENQANILFGGLDEAFLGPNLEAPGDQEHNFNVLPGP